MEVQTGFSTMIAKAFGAQNTSSRMRLWVSLGLAIRTASTSPLSRSWR
jgi:hypothetical protein